MRRKNQVEELNEQERNWSKVIYYEGKDTIRCAQGYMADKGHFLKVTGTQKSVTINKQNIISIHASMEAENDITKQRIKQRI
jgi:hypothetical protein